MNYDEEQDVLNSDHQLQQFEDDYLYDAEFDAPHQKTSLNDLKYSANDEVFDRVKELIFNSISLNSTFGIENKVPYYEIDHGSKPFKLFLNKAIIAYIYNWLENGKTEANKIDALAIDRNASETYMLYLLKRDRINGMAYHNANDGYKAIYSRGTISYGKLPYNTEELVVKLHSLS